MSVYLVTRENGSAPLYSQIRDVLAMEIQELFTAGDALASESELAQRFGVNRHTLRRAIDELVTDGYVERRHGCGIFVLELAINYTIGQKTRFTENLQSLGKSTASRVLRKQVIPAPDGVATRLNIKQSDNVIFIETLREVEEKAFCLISHFLPFCEFSEVIEDYDHGSLHDFIKNHYAIDIHRSESTLSAILPEVDDARLLNMPRHTPVLRVKSININSVTHKPVEYAVTRFRGDATQILFKP